ncbi:MAG: glycoside hydrolase family 88 protein [Paludibacter sp.]|nr:glycoside hydrolase family 88 protein [Paludibacter sp.]
MRNVFLILAVTLFLVNCTSDKKKFIDQNFAFAEQQTSGMLKVVTDVTHYPRTTAKDGTLKTTNMYDWTSGFFAGNLWYLYEYTNDKKWKEQAIRWTESLEELKNFTDHHDLGFMMYCSYGNAYRLTGDPRYKEILIRSAESLCSRFDAKTGSIKSWNYRRSWDGNFEWFYPVIIDNMMNLELLFFAAKETNNPIFKEIAITHTETTLKNHFRSDYSTYHVVNYDTITGKALNKATMQGYTDASTWARGQAWAIYGFTMVYRETKEPRYLHAAMQAADYFLNHPNLPDDMIPYWDFNIVDSGFTPDWNAAIHTTLKLRDASAAAITASALFELSNYEVSKKEIYFNAAVQMIENLSEKYRGEVGNNNNFIIKHCVGSFPHNEEMDVPLVYADYYFLEALLRYKKAK